MRFLSNLHTHTVFSDGNNTPEEYVKAAIDKGFISIGFSEHATASYDPGCIKSEDFPAYYSEMNRLKERYNGRIEIYLGFESDIFEPADKGSLDFVIGSVHCIRDPRSGRFHSIDYMHEDFQLAITAMGGIEALVTEYFELVAGFAESYSPDIVGHMDLITKLNRGGRYFDTGSAWYKKIAERCAGRIAATGCIVEVNTGAISRGYTDEPYPSAFILEFLRDMGTPVTLSSDAHDVSAIDCRFDETTDLLRSIGYKSVKLMRGGGFVDVEI